ncbi:fimbrial protein, partial [Pseudomonas carnis]
IKLGILKVSTIKLSNSVTLTAPACQTANVNVHMGQHRLSDFPKNGAPSNKTIPFNIKIYNCPAGINKVMYSLVPTSSSPSLSDNQGIIKLNPGSTAMGVGLQVTDDSMVPVSLNTSLPFKEYSSAGGNFTIPLNARYFKIAGGSGITPGTANTEMTFVMSYL